MTAETDITAIDDGGASTALEVRTALTSVLGRADDHLLGEWQTPTLAGSWVAYGTPFQAPRYRKTASGIVYIEGLVKSGSGTIFTLPVGYRPAASQLFATMTYNKTIGRLDVGSDGVVAMGSGSSDYFAIHCSFSSA